jgi:molybdenum cofactor cytidylyltransferase
MTRDRPPSAQDTGSIPESGSGPVAVVLAAGASSRMGEAKALLDFHGRPCLELVLASCAEGGLRRVIVVTAPAADAVRARATHPALAVIAAVNPTPERGMLSSLQAGLRALPAGASAFLIFPVDFPLSPGREVRRLLDAFAARGADQRIFIPSHGRRRGHPVLVDAALAPELLALPPEATARALMTGHASEIVYTEAADDRVLMDMDTPDDYRRCLARYLAEPGRG